MSCKAIIGARGGGTFFDRSVALFLFCRLPLCLVDLNGDILDLLKGRGGVDHSVEYVSDGWCHARLARGDTNQVSPRSRPR